MMKTIRTLMHSGLAALTLFGSALNAQTAANTQQQLVFAGLRSVGQQGQINAVKADAAGNLYLLLDQKDGVRLLKTDGAGGALLGQALLGAKGDVGMALALDPAGNVYVAGTTSSGALAGTAGAAIPNRTDSSTNSFVAKFDAGLNPLFVTFTGGSRIAAVGLSATADAVFVTGTIYANNLPVTSNGIQQAPAVGSTQNGFVEKFSASGATLLYATYLTGALGDTTPAAIVADAGDNAFVVGTTTATGFPTVGALVPNSLSNPSGFLTRLTPAGDGIAFSTFVPGAGLSSITLDSTGQTLLATGSVALGQFPVDTVSMPLIPTNYQVLIRLPLDGSAVLSSTLIAAGTQSFVALAPNGSAWVDGTFATPGFPALALTPLATTGGGFAVRVNAANEVDQTARFGGSANGNATFASLPTNITSIAVDGAGEPLIAGSVQPTASANLLATQTYDLPLRNTPTAALPSSLRDAELSAKSCQGSLCAGSAAYLAKLNPNVSAPALAFSADDLPFVTLRNLGSAEADGLQVSATGATVATSCGTVLPAGGECAALLSGGGPGTLTASASDGGTQTISFGALPASAPASTIVFSPKELDFGVQTSGSAPVGRTITVTNLGTASQTFSSAIDASANPKGGTASPFSELASDCTLSGSIQTKVLAGGGSCHITLGLTASSSATGDGLLRADWLIGSRDVVLTGYSQAAALSVSASEIDFGTQFTNGLKVPRYLYLSNASGSAVSHAALALPAGSPFTLTDGCPATLLAGSVCRIRIDYRAAKSTSTDSTVLSLDQGLSVLLTGETLPPRGVTGSTVNPNLSVNPGSVTFTNATAVTGISSTVQTLTVMNTGASAFSLNLALTGDFTDVTSCGATLAGGQSCAVSVTFAPSQPGARQGLLAVTAGAGTSPLYVPLSGTGTAILPANNGTLELGSASIGQPVAQFFKVPQPFTALTVTATGPYKVILIEDVGFGHGTPPASAYASSVSGSCHNCFLGVQFLPSAAGVQTGSLTISSVAGGSVYSLALSGMGVPVSGLVLTPGAQDFGSVPVHSSSGITVFTLTNLGAAAVTVAGPALTGDFVLSLLPTGGAVCGGSLAAAASCSVGVEFVPTAEGARIGSLTFTGSGAGGSGTAASTLTGLAAADPGIAINPLGLSFNNVTGPSATVQTVTLTNTSGTAVSVGTPTTGNADFHAASGCGLLGAGASCDIAVSFVAGPATAKDALTIPVTSPANGANPVLASYRVTLNGSYTSGTTGLAISPGQSQYGPSPVGAQGSTRIFTVNNLTGKTVALSISIPRQFVLVGAPCTSLAANASCNFSVAFLPLTNGDIPGSLYAQAVPSDGSATLTSIAYVEGFGVGAGTLSVSGGLIVNGVYSFGQVTSGQTATQTFSLANKNAAGTAPITVRRVTSGPPFLSTTTCGAAIGVGQSCAVTVTYAPSNQVPTGTASPAAKADAGNLTIESDAASSPDVVNLAGQAGPIAVGNPANAAPLATFTLSQGSLSFATTTVGDVSVAQTVTLSNTGNVALHVSSAMATPDFTVNSGCGAVVPGGSCTLTVTGTPQAAGVRIGELEIASDAAVSLEFVSLIETGTASALVIAPGSLDFGGVLVGATSTQSVQLTNGSASPIVFNNIGASGDYSVAGSCPSNGGSLAAGATCSEQVTFAPTAAGVRSGVLSIGTSVSTLPLTVALTGVGGQAKLIVSPSSASFGAVPIGSSATMSLTLLNSGATPITSLAFSITGDYLLTTPCPQTILTAGASCAIQVTFTPTAAGTRTGSLVVTSSDPGSPATVALTGTGTQGGSFTLTVDGGATSTATVVSGQPATYHLALTPAGGFSGTVALTCTPLVTAQYANCSLLPSSLTLSNGTLTSLATINTITGLGGNGRLSAPLLHARSRVPVICLLLPGLMMVWRGRRRLRQRLPTLIAFLLAAGALMATGCGGDGPAAVSTTLYTPPGSYQYVVTASSTSGAVATQTVTLNLVVTSR